MTERNRPSDGDERLETLLRMDLVPERDPLFRIAVLQRLERQRFRRQLVAALTIGPVTAANAFVRTWFTRIAQSVSRSFGG